MWGEDGKFVGSAIEFGNPRGNLLPGEPVELDNSDLLAKLLRHDLHRLIVTVRLDDHPTAMYASFAAPVRVRYEVRAKLLACAKRPESGVVLTFFVCESAWNIDPLGGVIGVGN